MTERLDPPGMIRVVVADANALYARVLRDYLLYAAGEEIIAIAWSQGILDEVTEHLAANVAGFTTDSGHRLVIAMNQAFPYAEVEPAPEHRERLADLVLPDDDDRHVLVTAIAAEATVLCTANTRDIPDRVRPCGGQLGAGRQGGERTRTVVPRPGGITRHRASFACATKGGAVARCGRARAAAGDVGRAAGGRAGRHGQLPDTSRAERDERWQGVVRDRRWPHAP